MAPPHARALVLAAGIAGLIAGLGLGLRLGGGNSRESASSSRAWARAVAGASAGSAQPSTASAPALLHPQLAEFAACNLQEVKSGYSKGFQVRKQVVVRSTVARLSAIMMRAFAPPMAHIGFPRLLSLSAHSLMHPRGALST